MAEGAIRMGLGERFNLPHTNSLTAYVLHLGSQVCTQQIRRDVPLLIPLRSGIGLKQRNKRKWQDSNRFCTMSSCDGFHANVNPEMPLLSIYQVKPFLNLVSAEARYIRIDTQSPGIRKIGSG